VLFLEEVMEMRRRKNASAIEAIYSKYIQDGSPFQVNIDASLKLSIVQRISQRTTCPEPIEDLHVFDEAFVDVAKMVEKDSVNKFLQSQR